MNFGLFYVWLFPARGKKIFIDSTLGLMYQLIKTNINP